MAKTVAFPVVALYVIINARSGKTRRLDVCTKLSRTVITIFID